MEWLRCLGAGERWAARLRIVRKMKKYLLCGALLPLFLLGSGRGASAQGILPANPGGWDAAGGANVVGPAQLQNFAGEQSEILREYGVIAAEQRQYLSGAGAGAQDRQTVTLTLYKMVDPTAAYGAFTFLRDPAMRRMNLGDSVAYAAAGSDRALLVVGNYLVVALFAGPMPADSLFNDVAGALLPHADGRPYPLIAGYLPRSNALAPAKNGVPAGGPRLEIESGSERFVLGPRALAQSLPWSPSATEDWLGFSRSAEAVAVRYRESGKPAGREVTLLVTVYPTQQIAASQFGTFGRWMAINASPEQAGGKPVVYGGRSSALIALVFGAESREQADSLIGQIQYRSAVTWNEPSHEATEPPFSTMIIGVFEGTGIIMVLAVAVGIGFGGFRLVVKLLLPGRVFDRDSQVEILQLGLTSKPIDSRDFY